MDLVANHAWIELGDIDLGYAIDFSLVIIILALYKYWQPLEYTRSPIFYGTILMLRRYEGLSSETHKVMNEA